MKLIASSCQFISSALHDRIDRVYMPIEQLNTVHLSLPAHQPTSTKVWSTTVLGLWASQWKDLGSLPSARIAHTALMTHSKVCALIDPTSTTAAEGWFEMSKRFVLGVWRIQILAIVFVLLASFAHLSDGIIFSSYMSMHPCENLQCALHCLWHESELRTALCALSYMQMIRWQSCYIIWEELLAWNVPPHTVCNILTWADWHVICADFTVPTSQMLGLSIICPIELHAIIMLLALTVLN